MENTDRYELKLITTIKIWIVYNHLLCMHIYCLLLSFSANHFLDNKFLSSESPLVPSQQRSVPFAGVHPETLQHAAARLRPTKHGEQIHAHEREQFLDRQGRERESHATQHS